MLRAACLLLMLFAVPVRAAELPASTVLRLGDERFRAGSSIESLALSPDGKQFATTRTTGEGTLALTVWDSATGLPIREREVNTELFHGLVWGPRGGFAVVRRAELGAKDKAGTFIPNDFRIWNFADAKSLTPPLLPVTTGVEPSGFIQAERPRTGDEYTRFAFSANSQRIAALWNSADGKHAVHIFDAKPTDTATRLIRVATLELGAEGVDAIRLSADGKTLVTCRKLADPNAIRSRAEFTATAWDVATGKPAKPVRARGARVLLTPDAQSLVCFAANETEWGFNLLNLATGRSEKLIRWPLRERATSEPLEDDGGAAFFPDGHTLVVGIDRKAIVIDVNTGTELGRIEGHLHTPTAIAVSADGTCIATADSFGLVRLWNAKTLRPLHDAPGHRAPVEHAQLSPDGKRLVTWAEDRTVRVWELATGKELRAFASAPGLHGTKRYSIDQPTFTPDGLAVLFSTKERLIARDVLLGLEVPLPGELGKLPPRFAVFSPDGKSLLTWAGNAELVASVEVWDWETGKKRFAVVDVREVNAPGFAPDSSSVFIEANSPYRWDSYTGKRLAPLWRDDRTDKLDVIISLRADSRLLLHSGRDGLQLLAAGSGERVSRFAFASAEPDSRLFAKGIALSPTGMLFAVSQGTEPGEVLLCETATGQVRRELRGHRGSVRVLGFSPTGTRLLTAGGDHTILVWDVRLQAVPLTDGVKRLTSAARLWDYLAAGSTKDAYQAMARLATEPDTAVKIARLRLQPATANTRETPATQLADSRAIELLQSLDTEAAREFLLELANGDEHAFRTRTAKNAVK